MTQSRARTLTTVVRALLTGAIVAGYGAVILHFASEQTEISDKMERILTMLLGTLTAILQMVVSFWFGTSQGSAEKSADISSDKLGGK